MENTLLVATSHQDALRRQMEVIAHNFANMNTNGFKRERMMFVDHLVRGAGGDAPSDKSLAFVRDVATYRDLSDGNLTQTGNPLDVAIEGDGFFVVGSPEGERYSRNGSFVLNDEGQLVTGNGMPVLSGGGQPVYFSTADTEITISRDGTISTENGVLGRLRIVRFENPHGMRRIEGGLMSSDAIPEEVVAPRVVQGMVEGSNVEPILEMERMISVHRAYESSKKLVDGENERIRKMIQVYAS
jgi:flagellar basal-body rod protein FlgF